MNAPQWNVTRALPVLLTSAVVLEVASKSRPGSFTRTKRNFARCLLDMILGGTRADVAVMATLLTEIGVQSPGKNIHYKFLSYVFLSKLFRNIFGAKKC
jgi:hypothetical protein